MASVKVPAERCGVTMADFVALAPAAPWPNWRVSAAAAATGVTPNHLGVLEQTDAAAVEQRYREQAMSQEHAAEPTPKVLLQRVRNRIIEYLELTRSFDAQRQYQSCAPVHVPNEVINQWEDWVRGPRDPAFVHPVFSKAEQDAIARFHGTWRDVAANTRDPLPELDALLVTAEWQALRDAADDALRVFLVRGKLSEDEGVEGP